jgi:hypothetical protein
MLGTRDGAPELELPGLVKRFLTDLSGGTRVMLTSRAEWRELRNQHCYTLHDPTAEAAIAIFQAMVDAEPPAFPPNGHTPALAKAARCHPKLMHYAVRWLNDRPPDSVLQTLTTLKGADAEEALDDMVLRTVQQVRAGAGGEAAIARLQRLLVFRGGFTYEAAQAILGADADQRPLATLKQWRLVGVENGRYAVDPLVAMAVE